MAPLKPYDAPSSVALAPAVLMTDDALLAAVQARGETTGKASSNQTLFIMAALFIGLGGLRWGWRSVVYLAVAIALHELGHVFAMIVFGYKNVRVLFVPLFGGLAMGEPRELDATKNALVALAGPVLGLVTAVGAAVIAVRYGSPAWLVSYAWTALFLNAFNLLPLVPLDGGQFANDALFSRYPVVELIFRLVAIAGLAWLTLTLHLWILGLVALFMLVSTPLAFRRARLIRDARRDPRWQTRELDREAVVELRGVVTSIFKAVAQTKYQAKLLEHVHAVWLEIRKRFPGPGTTVALLASYGFLCVVVVPVIAVCFARFLPRPAL